MRLGHSSLKGGEGVGYRIAGPPRRAAKQRTPLAVPHMSNRPRPQGFPFDDTAGSGIRVADTSLQEIQIPKIQIPAHGKTNRINSLRGRCLETKKEIKAQ